jgi:IS30 family transposase
MAHTALDVREGRAIADMLNAKAPVSGIAAETGRHRATICREIERNAFGNDDLSCPSGDCGATAGRLRTVRQKPDARDATSRSVWRTCATR